MAASWRYLQPGPHEKSVSGTICSFPYCWFERAQSPQKRKLLSDKQQEEFDCNIQHISNSPTATFPSSWTHRWQPLGQSQELLSECTCSFFLCSCPEPWTQSRQNGWAPLVLGLPSFVWIWNKHSQFNSFIIMLISGEAAPAALSAHGR